MLVRVTFVLSCFLVGVFAINCRSGSDVPGDNEGGVSGAQAEGGVGGTAETPGPGSAGHSGGAGGVGGLGAKGGEGVGGGAGTSTATAGGASGSAGGTAGVAPSSNCGELSICEDFESSALGAFINGKTQIEGGDLKSYSISDEQKHSGSHSVKITTEGASPDRMLKIAGLDAKVAEGKTVFGRVWMYFPSLPQTSRDSGGPHYRLLRFFEVGPSGSGALVSAGIVGSDRGRMLYFRAQGFKDCAKDGATMPAGKWACRELRADSSGYEGWIDGKSMGASSAVNADECWQKHTKVSSAGFGFQFAAGTLDKPLTFYMDDIALDEQRIGCN